MQLTKKVVAAIIFLAIIQAATAISIHKLLTDSESKILILMVDSEQLDKMNSALNAANDHYEVPMRNLNYKSIESLRNEILIGKKKILLMTAVVREDHSNKKARYIMIADTVIALLLCGFLAVKIQLARRRARLEM